jgi:hypothetical protein
MDGEGEGEAEGERSERDDGGSNSLGRERGPGALGGMR